MYLSAEKYTELTGKQTNDFYKTYEMRASAELDVITRFYYQFNELKDDFKGNQFLKAIAIQIDFMTKNNGETVEDMNNKPDSVRIGDSTVTYNRTGTNTESSRRYTAVSQDAMNLLAPTGLLYRGAYHDI